MSKNPTYRGELLPRLDKLTDVQISDRLREAAKIDNILNAQLDSICLEGTSPAFFAAIRAYRSLLDMGLSSIAVAEHRIEVQFFTQPVEAKSQKKGRRRG